MILIVIISLSFLIFIHELGHFLAAKIFGVKVEEFGFGFPPRLLSRKIGETVYSLNLLPFGGFVKLYGEHPNLPKHPNKNTNSYSGVSGAFIFQPAWKKSIIVSAGILMNIFFGWLILSIVLSIGIPRHLVISETAKDSPAALIGLKSGDIILKAEFPDKVLADPIKSDEFIQSVKGNLSRSIPLTIQRGGEVINVVVLARVNPPPGQGALGIGLIESGLEKTPVAKSLIIGLKETAEMLKFTFLGFLKFFSQVLVKPAVIENLTGPVGLVSFAAKISHLGLVYLLHLISIISINLAVLNILPVPALDGGRLVFLGIEKIKGSPVSYKIEGAVNLAGFVFLVLLMIVVTIKDVGGMIN